MKFSLSFHQMVDVKLSTIPHNANFFAQSCC